MTIKRKRANREKIFFYPDIHFPHEDKEALAIADNACNFLKPGTIVNLGDALDFYSLSRFDKDPSRLTELQSEFDKANAHFLGLRERHPEARILMKEGNHEERFQKHLWANSAPLSSLRCLTVPDLLGLPDLNVEWYGANERCQIADTVITHGRKLSINSGMSGLKEAKGRGRNGISGHCHRLGKSWFTDDSKTISWVEAGCLCRKDAVYAGDSSLNWQQGFVVGDLISYKGFERLHLEIVPILDGCAYYQGNIFTPDGVMTHRSP